MAATRIIEEERGTWVGSVHPHNGYYAGDFSRRDGRIASEPSTLPRTRHVLVFGAEVRVQRPV